MRSRPPSTPKPLPSGGQWVAFLVLAVAATSLAGAALVQAGGGLTTVARRAAAAVANAGACSPEVASLSAPTGPAAGGVLITINGSNFLAAGSPPSVRFGHAVAALVSATDTELVVTCPAQRDAADASVTVVLPDGRSSDAEPFAYEDAVATAAPDASASFGGGTVITIHGSNFACSAPRAWLDDGTGVTAECRVVEAADESLVVELPDWSGASAALRVGIVHRDIAARNVLFDGPELASVSPPTFDARGGTHLTLTGSNFVQGAEGSRVHVLRGGRAIEAPIVSQTNEEIVAIVPELLEPSSGQMPVGVCVERAGRKSRTYQNKADQDVAGTRYAQPAGVSAAGGTTITIVGDNFRAGATVNGLAANVLDASHLEVTLPPMAPGLHALTVEQNGKPSPPVELEVADAPQLFSVSPPVVPLEGGAILTLTGSNFGVRADGLPRVARVEQAGSPPRNVGPVRWMAPEALRCVAPPGSPGPADLTVMVAGVPVTLPNAFTYAGASPDPLPVLDSMEPDALTRLGGNLITLHGSNFGAAGTASVVFGSTGVTPATQTDTEITFVQPPVPAGLSQNPIYVDKGQAGSNPLHRGPGGSILSAAVSSVTGYAGGNVITITGSDFSAGALARFSAPDGGSIDCRALHVTPESLLVTAPEVDEHEWNELRVVQDGIASPPLAYTLSGPRITGLSTRELSAAGGAYLTISGANFGSVAPLVQIGTATYPPVLFNPTEITVKKRTAWDKKPGAPPVEPVRVIVPGGATSDSFHVRWKAPELNSQSDDRAARAGGGGLLTIHGSDFGAASVITISGGAFGVSSPPVVDRSPTELVVQLEESPPGTFEMAIVDPDLGSSPPALLHRLAPPAVTSVEPPVVPLAGNVLITIVGSNFGPPGADLGRSVRLAGSDCPLGGLLVAEDGLRVLVPAGAAGPADLVVTVDGVADTIPGAFTYGNTTDAGPAPAAPRALALRAGPTPFRGDLGLSFALPVAGPWTIDVFDASGARVRRFAGDSPAALHELRWDGRTSAGAAAPPGVYFARITAAGAQRIARAVKLE